MKKIDCLMCTPTNERLFHPDIELDMKSTNKCVRPKRTTITAEQILYNDINYYYTSTPTGNITIYEYKKNIDAYTIMDRSHPHYDGLVDYITRIVNKAIIDSPDDLE